ncbi:MAG: hypothetical protein WCE63_06105 [Acidobacteriaceae bacterium]
MLSALYGDREKIRVALGAPCVFRCSGRYVIYSRHPLKVNYMLDGNMLAGKQLRHGDATCQNSQAW